MIKKSRPKRIAIVSPIFSDPLKHGGITPVIWNLASGMAEKGFSIDLLIRRANPGSPPPAKLPEGVHIVDNPSRHRATTALGLASYMRQSKPSAVLAAGHRFNLAAVWASRLAPGIPVFLSVHNTMSREAMEKGSFHLRKRMASISFFYKWSDGIIAVSQGVAEDLISRTSLAHDKIRVIHNPVLTPEFLHKSGEPFDHPWFAQDSPPVILGVGRLNSQKAFDVLIKAVAILRKKKNCRLFILGEGPDRRSLEKLAFELGISQSVNLPGFVKNPYPYMRKAAVFALSSIYEGLPTVLVEALALGTPVVSTDCPSGPAEILNGGRYGRLVPPEDPQALAEAILSILIDPPSPELSSEAVKPYDIERVVDQYLEYMGLCPPKGQ